MKRAGVLGSSLWVWAMACAAAQATLSGVVTLVTDGDSLRFAPAGKAAIAVRLRDIDAPEACQVWGEEARRALAELALDKSATLQTVGRDPHGRTLGVLMVDGVDVGQRLVEEGHAWSVRTRWDRGPLVGQERMAKALRRGLHGLPGAVMPSEFRQAHGPCVATPTADRPAVAAPVAPAARLPRAETQSAPAAPAAPGRCDGRTRCSQMRSCEEARYFLQHCPGVQMDGDGDGVPCETQWCR